jgi:CheY-like chemotaxis protein
MVHGLVTQLGGLLELSSTVGRGATAAIYLPVTVATLPDAPPSPAPDLASRPATILLVEDDMLIAMSTAEMLADLGHSVIEASSAQRALDILEAGQRVDLIITDHAMPGLTGTQLAEAVRRTRPELPILLATGYAEMPAGHLNLPRLAKPYQQADLKRAISGLLAAAPARAE